MGKGKNNPDQALRYRSFVDRIWARFAPADLAAVCAMDETDFPAAYEMDVVDGLAQRAPNDWFAFKDNGSEILAVAHLDTVSEADERRANFVYTEAGSVVFSRALDDRLGAYTILELLPKLGLTFDILLTVGEEQGQSTAAFFEAPKKYKWIIEFDRGGTDVVLYQYENEDMRSRVKASGARVGVGSYSDVSYMSHVGAKGINWGVGYRDYHGPRAHAYIEDYVEMIAYFLEFHRTNQGVALPHDVKDEYSWGRGKQSRSSWGTTGYSGAWLDDADEDDEALARKWLGEDDEGDDLAFEKWLRDRAEYSPDATCPGVAHDITDQIVDDHIEATRAQALALPTQQLALPEDVERRSLLGRMLQRD
jgi:hypothetical protein